MTTPVDTKQTATLTAVGDTVSASKVTKGAKAKERKRLERAVRKATKGERRKVRKLKKSLQVELARPNPELRVHRIGMFQQPEAPVAEAMDKSGEAARARKLARDIKDRNAGPEAIEELRSITSPQKFSELMTTDGD